MRSINREELLKLLEFLRLNVGLGDKTEYLIAPIRMYNYVVETTMTSDCWPDGILDVGCSSGYGTHILSSGIANARVTGIDIEERRIEECQRLFKAPGVAFERVDITDSAEVGGLLEKEGLFDQIVCFEVFEHLTAEDSKKLLQSLKRTLRANGCLFVSTPNKEVYDVDAYTQDHINELSCEGFLDTLRDSGFRPLEVRGVEQKSALSTSLLKEFNLAKRDGDRKVTLSMGQKLLRRAIISLFDWRALFAFILSHLSTKRYFEWKYRTAINSSPEQSRIVLVRAYHESDR